MVMKENEEDLALFLDLQKREQEKDNLILVQNIDDFDGSKPGSAPILKSVVRKTATEEFLNSDNEKADYDWLIAPPITPLFPSLEMESQKTINSQVGNVRPAALKSRLTNSMPEPLSKSDVTSRHASSTPALNVSNSGNRRPSSSGGRASTNCRPATPTGRATFPAMVKPSRPSTPTSRPTVPSIIKPTASGVRSSTPTRSTARSSTPTARPSVPVAKSTSRSATPTRRASTPSSVPRVSVPPDRSSSVTKSAPPGRSSSVTKSVPPGRSSSVTKSAPPGRSSSVTKSAPMSKSSISSRGVSPPVKSRPWKPTEIPGFSVDTPPNLRTSIPGRSASASKGRLGVASARPSSVEAVTKEKPRQQSQSPLRGQAQHRSVYGNGSSVPARSRAHSNTEDHVSPVLIGTQMVERVINMRRLAPPKQDDLYSTHGSSVGKSSSSLDGSGFGRTLSKKSLDMAIRHMGIRQSTSGNLRPVMTKIPASSMYSVRSGNSKGRPVGVLDSPLATSSNASSEPSVNYNSNYLDGSEMEDDDIASEKGISTLASQQGR